MRSLAKRKLRVEGLFQSWDKGCQPQWVLRGCCRMKQNLFWASFYNILAIPIAAGILYPNFGIILRPEVSALLMSASSIIVATNAVLLKRAEKNLVAV